MRKLEEAGFCIYRQVVRAKLFMEDHFHEQLNLDKIAMQAYISKFHFHRIFKEMYGRTPHQYLGYLRIRESKNLLAKGYSTREVCISVGFKSVSSFIKLFKRQENCTPFEFGRRAYSRNEQIHSKPLDFVPGAFAAYLGWVKD